MRGWEMREQELLFLLRLLRFLLLLRFILRSLLRFILLLPVPRA